jgi:hypothetical protein
MKLTAVLSSTLLMGSAAAIPNGWVHNRSGVDRYIFSAADPASCVGIPCETKQIKVPPGATYAVQFRPVDGAAGSVTVKFQTSPTLQHVYQAEYALKAGKIWYNWSAVDGSPLIGLKRVLQIGDGLFCANSICEAGSSSCDWGKDASGKDYNIFSYVSADIIMNIY